jgi:uncharacterized protein YndB with AHSA1/START domain
MKHTPPPTEPIVVECDLPQPPALVWRALTERDLLAAWLLPNDLRPEVGARFSFEQADQHDADSIDCEVLAVEPARTLKWRQTEAGDADSGWQPVTSVVTIELTDHADGGTHLRLVHDEFAVVPATAAAKACANVTALDFRRKSSKPRMLAMRGGPDIVCQLRRAA